MCEQVAARIAEVIYTPGFTAEDAASMEAMREKLANKAGPASIKRAGRGGVVDVEFVVQMLALRHGAADPGLREGNVPRLLERLKDRGALEAQAAADLYAAYAFLLSLESKIRIVADLREDRLPDGKELRALARRLGYVDSGDQRAEDSLRAEHAYHRDVAARAFRQAVRRRGQTTSEPG